MIFTENFEKFTSPLLPGLRRSIIYNDANDYNILLGGGEDIYSRNQSVTGFIDLGDMVYGTTVGDLAIAIAYAILDKPQPLAVAAEIVKGYPLRISPHRKRTWCPVWPGDTPLMYERLYRCRTAEEPAK